MYTLDSEAPASEDRDGFDSYIRRETTINTRDLPTTGRVLAEDDMMDEMLRARRGAFAGIVAFARRMAWGRRRLSCGLCVKALTPRSSLPTPLKTHSQEKDIPPIRELAILKELSQSH